MEEPEFLTPSSSGRSSAVINSPEFEFWMVRNPSCPQPNLLSADELFSDGVMLPLQLLHPSNEAIPAPGTEDGGVDRVASKPESLAAESAQLSATSAFSSSKRWRDMFKKNEKKSAEINGGVKEKRREKKNGGGGGVSNGVTAAAELNINIWPFSRSRSAGNGGTRPRSSATTRKVSSAPCSRSNSAGESKSRKWPASPGRVGGVPVGRASPVWQVRRSGVGRSVETVGKTVKKDSSNNAARRKISSTVPAGGSNSRAKVFSLNVPMCIGYRHHLSCRNDENSTGGHGGGGVSGGGVRGGGNLFGIRSLFTKKVY